MKITRGIGLLGDEAFIVCFRCLYALLYLIFSDACLLWCLFPSIAQFKFVFICRSSFLWFQFEICLVFEYKRRWGMFICIWKFLSEGVNFVGRWPISKVWRMKRLVLRRRALRFISLKGETIFCVCKEAWAWVIRIGFTSIDPSLVYLSLVHTFWVAPCHNTCTHDPFLLFGLFFSLFWIKYSHFLYATKYSNEVFF